MNKRSLITTLNKILSKGVMSPKLKEAVEAILEAVKAGDIKLATNLSAVKSYITGVLDPKDKTHAFQEEQYINEKTLGNSIYCLMDGINFQLAMSIKEMPAGMMLVSANKPVEEFKIKGTHPIIKCILKEQKAIEAKYPR